MSLPVHAAILAFLDEGLMRAGPKPVWLGRVPAIRARMASLIGAQADEVAFTRNTSDGLNAAAQAIPWRAGDSVVMIEGDHPNNSYAWLNLQRRGIPVHFARIPGHVDALSLEPWLRQGTRVLALSHVTSDTGRRCDLASIGALCRARGVHLVVDAIQSLGIWPLDVHALGISMLASGCHKGLLVPQGLGLLYVDGSIPGLQPAYLAAAAVANAPADRRMEGLAIELRPAAGRFETGNLSLPQLHGLDAALGLIEQLGPQHIAAHVGALGQHLIGHLDRLGIGLLGARDPQQGSHIHLLDLPGPACAAYLAQNGVRVSAQPDAIRVSLAMFNTLEEVDRLAAILAGAPR